MSKRIDFNDIQASEEDKPAESQRIDWNTIKQGAQDDLSMMGVLLESGARNLFDSTMNIPNALGKTVGNALAYPTAAIMSGTQALAERAARANFDRTPGFPAEPLTPFGGFSDNLAEAQNVPIVRDLIRGYDAPTSTDVQALFGVAPRAAYQYRTPEEYGSLQDELARMDEPLTDMGKLYHQMRDEFLEGYIQRREAQPLGAGSGDVLGDVASLFVARKPFVSASRQARLARGETAPAATAASQTMTPDWRRFVQRQSEKYSNWFKESGIKVAETGIEGAYLAAIQDEDPIMAAAAGAGLQAATNFTERVWSDIPDFGMKPGITRTGIKAGITAFGITSLIQMFKELSPAGRDRILESEEAGYKKAALTMMAAATLHLSGFGRPTRQQLNELGMLADTWHSARRGSILSLISEIENDDSGDVDRVWMAINQDPNYFDTTALRRLNRAFENDDISHKETIETLMESDRHFRRKVIALRENPQIMNQPFQQTRRFLGQGVDAVESGLDRIDQRARGLLNE